MGIFQNFATRSLLHTLPLDLRRKEAPGLDVQLKDHIELVTKALATLKDNDKTIEQRIAGHEAEMFDLAQKMSRRGSGGGDSIFGVTGDTWGQQFAASDGVKAFAGDTSRRGVFRMEVKTITSASTSSGALVTPQRDDVVAMARRRLVIRNLLQIVNTETGLIQYPRQKTRTNNAATVAETVLKPESDYAFELKDVPVRTIAHWVGASRQIMDDAPQLAGLIDQELSYGLALIEEAQILFGDNNGENLNGIVPQAAAFAAPFAIETMTMIDRIGLAILQSALTDVEPDGVVMHPSDWMRIRLTKNADGDYIYGDPAVAVTPVIFGLPVVPTVAMTVDKFLTGPFGSGATLYDRMAPTIMVSTEDRDNFVRNKVTVLAEERIGFADKRPESFIFGDFGNVA